MDYRIRLGLVLAVVALIVIRVFNGDFLAIPIFPGIAWLAWLTWFLVTFLVLGYLAAWAISPAFAQVINRLARWGVLPLSLFIIVGLGLLMFGDMLWNELVASWCDPCPTANMAGATMRALSGGH